MPRFFINSSDINDGKIAIRDCDAHHISRVLRMRTGDTVYLCDGFGTDYVCVISDISDDCVYARIKESGMCAGEPSVNAALYIALAKGDKTEHILQKAVELGANEIVPFISERCVSRPDRKSYAARRKRYERIILEAAKQCGRGIIPRLNDLLEFEQAVSLAARSDMPLFLYELEGNSYIRENLTAGNFKSVSIMTGPEGGFSEKEAQSAKNAGMISVSLGKRILRCETAPLAALCAVMYATGNFE